MCGRKKAIHSLFESQSVTMSDSENDDQPSALIKSENGPERQGSVKRRKPGLKGLAMQMKKLKTFSNVATDAAIANSKLYSTFKKYKRSRGKHRYLPTFRHFYVTVLSVLGVQRA